MSPRKLGGSRGLHPQESRPGVLRGYRLAFNHRGGFGNIQPVADPTRADPAVAGCSAEQQNALAASAAARAGVSSNPATASATAAAAAGTAVPGDVHGVLHKLSPAELVDLMCIWSMNTCQRW